MADIKLRTGELRHRVVYQTLSSSRNTTGQETLTWNNIGTFWAAVEALVGREIVNADQLRADQDWRVTLRYLFTTAVIVPTGQFLWTDLSGTTHTLRIDAVSNIAGRNFKIICDCTEVVAGG